MIERPRVAIALVKVKLLSKKGGGAGSLALV